MLRRIEFLYVVVIAAALVCGAASAGGPPLVEKPQMVDNPAYQSWAKFKAGSFATLTSTTTQDELVSTNTKITYTLKEVTAEKVVVEVKTVTVTDEEETELPAETVEYPAKIAKPQEVPGTKTVAEGTKAITVNGKEIATKCVKTETTQDGVTVTTTVWTSESVPGGMVKSVTETGGDMPTTTELVLTDYKAVTT
jgi:uncharacterized Zn-binding protein involved in type VI secretion